MTTKSCRSRPVDAARINLMMSWDLSQGLEAPIVIAAKASKPRSGSIAWPALALGIDRREKSSGPDLRPSPKRNLGRRPKTTKSRRTETSRAADARPCAAPASTGTSQEIPCEEDRVCQLLISIARADRVLKGLAAWGRYEDARGRWKLTGKIGEATKFEATLADSGAGLVSGKRRSCKSSRSGRVAG